MIRARESDRTTSSPLDVGNELNCPAMPSLAATVLTRRGHRAAIVLVDDHVLADPAAHQLDHQSVQPAALLGSLRATSVWCFANGRHTVT